MSHTPETYTPPVDERSARHMQALPKPLTTPSDEPEGVLFDVHVDINKPDNPREMPTQVMRGKTRVGGATLRFTVETPPDLDDDVPELFVQGFMGPELVYRDLRQAAAQQGRRAVTVGRAGIQLPGAFLRSHHLLRPSTVTEQSPWAVIKALGEEEVDVVAHSMGGPISVAMALRRHENVRSLTLLGSAGLTGHTPLSLAAHLPAAASEIKKGIPALRERYGVMGALAVIDYFLKNPARPISEALMVASADVRPDLIVLRERDVKVVIGAFTNDCFFEEEVMRRETEGKVDVFEEIEANLAGHIAPQLEPEIVMAQVLAAQKRLKRAT